ncbi:MAG: hypothetical protein AAB883_00760, partial [Patescibacteria group bacterium]
MPPEQSEKRGTTASPQVIFEETQPASWGFELNAVQGYLQIEDMREARKLGTNKGKFIELVKVPDRVLHNAIRNKIVDLLVEFEVFPDKKSASEDVKKYWSAINFAWKEQIREKRQALLNDRIVRAPASDVKPDDFASVAPLLILPTSERHRIGCGILDDQLYFGIAYRHGKTKRDGIVFDDGRFIIDRKDDAGGFAAVNFHPSCVFLDDALPHKWQNQAVMQWCEFKGRVLDVSVKELVDRVRDVNRRCVWHVDERVHDLIACDVVATYFLPCFKARGRIFLNADKESGKTAQTQVYATLAFNALMSVNMSPSSMFRSVESTCATLLVDDFDDLQDDERRELVRLLRAYKCGVPVIRVEGDRTRRPQAFDTFGSVVINNIGGLDPVTESRCITIRMQRCEASNFVPERIRTDDPQWAKVRSDARVCAFQHWREVRETYDAINEPLLSNRALELSASVLSIARLAGCYDAVRGYLVETFEQAQAVDYSGDVGYQVLRWLQSDPKVSWVGLGGLVSSEVMVGDFSEAVAKKLLGIDGELESDRLRELVRKKRDSVARIAGRKLRTWGFKVKKSQGYAKYAVRKDDVNRILRTYYGDDGDPPNAPNPTNTTISTNPPNSTNTTEEHVIDNRTAQTNRTHSLEV